MANFFSLVDPLYTVNKAPGVDDIYNTDFESIEDALTVLDVRALPGRQFRITDNEGNVKLYIYQGIGKEPMEAGSSLVSADNTFYIEQGKLYTNLGYHTQVEVLNNAPNISFPIVITKEVDYKDVRSVFINGDSLAEGVHYIINENNITISDFRNDIIRPLPSRYVISIQGVFFIKP